MTSKSVSDLLKRFEEQRRKTAETIEESDNREDDVNRRTSEKEVEQVQYFLYDGARLPRHLRSNLTQRHEQRVKTGGTMQDAKKKIQNRMEDKKIADTVAHSIRIAGGIAAFVRPTGATIPLIAAGTSFAIGIASDIVTSILDEGDFELVNGCLNMAHGLEAETSPLTAQLERAYELLETLYIKGKYVFPLVILAANYGNVETYGIVQ